MLSFLSPFLSMLFSIFRSRYALRVGDPGAAASIGCSGRSAKKRPKLTVVDRVLYPTGLGHGHRTSTLRAAIPVATGLRRARHWHNPTGVPRPCGHLQRSGSVRPDEIIRGILSPVPTASLAI